MGVNVAIKGTTKGATTNADGNFQLSSDGMSLVSDSTKLSVLDWLSVHPARKEGESLKVILH